VSRRVKDQSCTACRGMAAQDATGKPGIGTARNGQHGLYRLGEDGQAMVWNAEARTGRNGAERVARAWSRKQSNGSAGDGSDGLPRMGVQSVGADRSAVQWRGCHGLDSTGSERHGADGSVLDGTGRNGAARQGKERSRKGKAGLPAAFLWPRTGVTVWTTSTYPRNHWENWFGSQTR